MENRQDLASILEVGISGGKVRSKVRNTANELRKNERRTMIYLLCVYHHFQTEEYPEFLKYVRDFCQSHDIKSMGEETSFDGLRDAKKDKSTIKLLADERSIPHAYCDPGKEERQHKGIWGEGALKQWRLFHEWTDEQYESELAMDNQKREPIWLERLQKVFLSPMLFVCGIDHLPSFSSLLKANGFKSQEADRRWDLKDLEALKLLHSQRTNPVRG